jgi:hypothetical protein
MRASRQIHHKSKLKTAEKGFSCGSINFAVRLHYHLVHHSGHRSFMRATQASIWEIREICKGKGAGAKKKKPRFKAKELKSSLFSVLENIN